MNIDDLEAKGEVKTVQDMFAKQKQLMEKYDKIEASNGAQIPEPPYSLDDRIVQSRLKDLFWRVDEELAEASEAVTSCAHQTLRNWKSPDVWATKPSIRHYFEELADALHFLVESSIISNLSPSDAEEALAKHHTYRAILDREQIALLHWDVVYWLGIAANCLKNKPWKQTAMPTDKERYKKCLKEAWQSLGSLFASFGCSTADMLNLYERKFGVNQWRQDTHY